MVYQRFVERNLDLFPVLISQCFHKETQSHSTIEANNAVVRRWDVVSSGAIEWRVVEVNRLQEV